MIGRLGRWVGKHTYCVRIGYRMAERETDIHKQPTGCNVSSMQRLLDQVSATRCRELLLAGPSYRASIEINSSKRLHAKSFICERPSHWCVHVIIGVCT